jgi:hypothetical protein
MKPEIVFQTPTWYLLLCLLLAVGFAMFFYFKNKTFNKKQTLSLAIIRGILVGLIAFLLLSPLIKTIKNLILKPKVLVVLDNSKSINYAGKGNIKDMFNGLLSLVESIESKGFEVLIKDLNAKEIKTETLNENFEFKETKTNFSTVFSEIRNNYEGQNLSDVILISDGIINDGMSPVSQKNNFNIHTVGLGDTTQKRDVYVSGITANKLAYLGNKFTLNADINSYLLKGQATHVSVKNGSGNVLAQKNIVFNSNDSFQTVSFELMAERVGKQRFVVEVKPVLGEFTTKNNTKEIVIDIINGKEKILLVAFAAHPDIKAFKNIIEKNDLFELNIQIIQSIDMALIGNEPFDILILHQLPDVYGSSTALVSKLLAKQKPTFFVLGSKTNISIFNGMQNVVGINSALNKFDKSTAELNSSFNLFNLETKTTDLIRKLPPLSVPFGEYKTFPGAETILSQKIADIATSRPLLALNLNASRKAAVMIGEGLWQWRQEEYAANESQTSVDEIITKTLQLLSVKDDKSKLKVYPVQESFGVDQKIIFESEAYNELFEKIYDQSVQINIKGEKGIDKKYNFTISKESSRFELSNLPAGLYNYSASSKILGKNETTSGQFLVTSTDLESLNSVADYNLLKTISNENNGDFVTSKNIIALRNSLEKKGLLDKIISNEELREFINLRWLLAIIIALAAVEWVLRKYFGSY